MSQQTIDISTSREEIRQQLLDEYAKILLINSEDLDQSDSAFNTYVLNALSYKLSDILYYASIIYRESTFITANLPETILNWATYIDYEPRKATAASVGLLIEIPIENAFSATIPKGHKFTASSGISFRSKYKVDIEVSPTGSKKVEVTTDTGSYALPINIGSTGNIPYISFIIEAEQYDVDVQEFTVPQLQPFEYYYKQIDLPEDTNILSISVKVDGDVWEEKSLVLLQPNEKGFEAIIHKNSLELLFGNGFFGKQPSGNVEVNIRTTVGKNGNVIAGTIINGDPLISNFSIKYSVINPEAASGGSDFESLEDIKRNAISSLKMMRRLVAEEDFTNISDILGISKTISSKPILKRSDLACNDVNVYVTINYNNKIVPTNSIPIPVSGLVSEYRPFTIFTYEGKEWVSPFLLSIDLMSKIITYYYIKPKDIYSITRIYENNSTHLVSKFESHYDASNDRFIFYCYIIKSDIPGINYSQEIVLETDSMSTNYAPSLIENLEYNIIKFTYYVPRTETVGVNNILINTSEDDGSGSVLKSQYRVTTELNFNMKEITYSHIIETTPSVFEALDIPVFEKTYWDSLSQDEQDTLEILAISDLISQVNSYDRRLMNVHVSGKFSKTIGQTLNTQYSTPDYKVSNIYKSTSAVPPATGLAGYYVALSDISDPLDPYYEFSGHLLLSDGLNWNPVTVGRGTIIKNNNDNILYSTDGRRWIPPIYDIPLNFVIETHLKYVNTELIDKIKNIVVEYVNDIGIEGNLYLSNIIDRLHNLEVVRYCRIIKPETDIIYRDIIKNMNRQEFYYYTPEYIFTTQDNIKIIPIID